MPDHRLLKSLLFGWLPESRPRCGPRRRWRDVICKDLKDISIAESKWYEEARRSRAGWRATYQDGLANHSGSRAVGATMAVCDVCFRTFRRESDRKRHKCVASLLVNNVGQPSARSVNLGLGAEVGWQSIDADWEASAAEISRDEPVAL